ncbi:hypothetical protein [Streptomyces sp. NPDC048172]|uniref:hypothetical protein n=1 Tax=Streptomyces sp. NPDC048172 TaxID=3365505 RepID=UPI0037138D22
MAESLPRTPRFRDPRRTRYHFLDLILVRCPRCAALARVVPVPCGPGGPAAEPSPAFAARRLVCRSCGLSRDRAAGGTLRFSRGNGRATDPYFDQPLWLQSETRHGWLWAHNLEHLELIRQFVQAPLRERAPWYESGRKMTVLARLPTWIKQAKNRAEVLRTVERIRASVHTAP